VHVKRTVRRRGEREYTYLSLVESVRVDGKKTHRTLLRLGEVGELERSGQLERIVTALANYTERHLIAVEDIEGEGAPAFGSVTAIATYFNRIGLREHFDRIGTERGASHLADTVLVMVANRLSDPSSKRRTITEWLESVALPDGVAVPSLDQCYRALDAVAHAKESTEEVLYARLCDLANLDLRLALYDLTSTYFETDRAQTDAFPSRTYGYSRDKRSDRPQVVIGLLVAGNGIPIAHYVFSGDTRDSTTLTSAMADYQRRFAIGKIALVADRGLISEKNLEVVTAAGFDHVLATRLHRDHDVRAALEVAVDGELEAVAVGPGVTATEVVLDGTRYVVVASAARKVRDDVRREELLARTEDKLIALAERVAAKRLCDPAKIGAAADRILRDSGVARCFTTVVCHGRFSWNYDEDALDYETRLLAGRYVLTTSLDFDQASSATVVRHYQMLQNVERRFRVMKDFLALRPVFHRTEQRVRGHIALCVIAATIEAVMAEDLAAARVMDPDVDDQVLTPRRALTELARIRLHRLQAGRRIEVIDRPSQLGSRVLDAFGVEASGWSKARIS
jgi:DDE family transposase